LVKDIIDTRGVRTTYGSAIFDRHVPDSSADPVLTLERAGAIVVGKCNLHEFAWGTTSQNPHFGTVENPTRPGHIAGGSSGGNAAALAGGLSPIGLGTDTGGSARGPSACCSTVGFKPPHGAISTIGVFPLAPSFDTLAPMARTVKDCVLLYSVLASRPRVSAQIEGVTVGILDRPPRITHFQPPRAERKIAQRLREVAERFEALGASVTPIDLPDAPGDLVPLVLAEAARSHRELFPARQDEYGADTREKLEAANRVTPEMVEESRVALASWRAMTETEPRIDIVICPTLGCDVPATSAREQDVRDQLLAYTRPFNFLDWAVIAVADFQIAGRDEATVLGAALGWEEAYGPPITPMRPLAA
jgi:aspartyl-tRNA(Asn)/glutamyl-tRNA(Gln) amidotransferase subunit A